MNLNLIYMIHFQGKKPGNISYSFIVLMYFISRQLTHQGKKFN